MLGGFLASETHRNAMTAFCSTTGKNLATILRGHTRTEAVNIDAPAATWLIRTLHDYTVKNRGTVLDRTANLRLFQLMFVTPGGNG